MQSVAEKYGKPVIITFDQPLYQIARGIISDKKSDVSCCFIALGTFHLLMATMAGISKLMNNTGLEEVMSTIYAENSLKSILNGKSYKRGMRAHSIVFISLVQLLVEQLPAEDFESPDKLNIAVTRLGAQSKTAKLWLQYMDMVASMIKLLNCIRTSNYEGILHAMMKLLPYLAACKS